MKKIFLLVIFLVSLNINSQNNFTFSGYVLDSQTNELVIGASVIIDELNIGTITNSYGFFSITVKEGDYSVKTQNLGYKDDLQIISLNKNIILNIYLTEEVESLDEVIVMENTEDIDIELPVLSLNIISGKTIRQTPVVFGESDILKTIQLLPGVSSAGEGASGFNVRGGAADQNLILFDEAIIYNSSHLFGLFSVFNSDAIKEVKLYKGGIPSSAHLFLKLTDIENIAYFYDLNTKSNFVIDNKNKIFLSGYFGRDLFKLDGTFMNTYGNSTLNLRWNHLINEKTFSNTSLIFSDYYYGLQLDFVGFDWKSGIKNLNFKFDLKNYYSNIFQFNYGLNVIYYDFNPGTIGPLTPDSGFNFSRLNKKYAFENSTYFDVIHKINSQLSMRYGIRLNQFLRLRQNGLQQYANDDPLYYDNDLKIYDPATPLAGNFDNNSSVFKTYNNIEPRINISYSFNNQSIKASYNRLNQYLHLISNTSSPTPLDIWVPSGPYIKPQKLDQYALGYYKF